MRRCIGALVIAVLTTAACGERGSPPASGGAMAGAAPGFSSYYLKPLDALASDRTVVRYDQLGGGKSTSITDTTMFTIPHFVAELDSLRAYLGYDRVHLLGHSWGTILAVEYYRAHPEHVASMVLASPALDIPAWERNVPREGGPGGLTGRVTPVSVDN